MSESGVETDRNSNLNKTMIISKKTPRPVLPQVSPDPSTNEPVHENDSQTLKISQPKRQRTSTVTLHTDQMGDNTEESDRARMEQIRREIIESQEQKENLQNLEGDNKIDAMVTLQFKYEIAHQAAQYADQFFSICERNGIDIQKVLANDPETLYNMKLHSNVMTPTTSEETLKELKTVKAERDNLAEEAKALKNSHSNLFKSYEKLRTNFELMREDRNILNDQVEKQQDAMNGIYKTALNFKEVMVDEAANADRAIAEAKGKYDSDTVTIRMNLIKLENENSSLKSEIESKNNEISQLRRIIHDIMKQVNVEIEN